MTEITKVIIISKDPPISRVIGSHTAGGVTESFDYEIGSITAKDVSNAVAAIVAKVKPTVVKEKPDYSKDEKALLDAVKIDIAAKG